MWERYRGIDPSAEGYQAWSFGGNAPGAADELAALVLRGAKTATSSAYPVYAALGEPLPKAGDHSVILDAAGQAVCVIRTTRVTVLLFGSVAAEHARREGERDLSLDAWREIHRAFFFGELAAIGQTFDEDMPVVCEEFERVFPR